MEIWRAAGLCPFRGGLNAQSSLSGRDARPPCVAGHDGLACGGGAASPVPTLSTAIGAPIQVGALSLRGRP